MRRISLIWAVVVCACLPLAVVADPPGEPRSPANSQAPETRSPAPDPLLGQPTAPPVNAGGPCGTWILIPARHETVTERVMVSPPRLQREWIPARYEKRSDQVVTMPASVRFVPVPATFETVTEEVVVVPARREWRQVACTEVQLAPGEIQGSSWCLVDVPAVVEKRTRQVLRTPPGFRREVVPATLQTVERDVLVGGGYYRDVPIPASFQTRTREITVAPAHWEWRTSTPCPPEATNGREPPSGKQPNGQRPQNGHKPANGQKPNGQQPNTTSPEPTKPEPQAPAEPEPDR